MLNTPIDSPNRPQPIGPDNPGIEVGNTVHDSGQGPIDPKTGKLVLGSFEEQTWLAFGNIKAVVEAGGATLADVTTVDLRLGDLSNFTKPNAVYLDFFASNFPAPTTVGSQVSEHIAIEVDCIAVLPG